ncbi:type I-C CRISPR-associated protein Cas7/Csd2 [Schleiferilactobacillus shenzhenensis]|uniref:Type I-C CRISPR-associated protein Cas7/Csd2 n=1 Tax=Schleiferilactobacillus shenzhenensis LY-73 TaxID=1231336 RepID=U4TIP6_9LACO|nr:type I-C CRISPR-associated protein Cas7/Csd2 [Schleiferilactobacillus shenzhenensis]ERL64691.1 hypothetical protein L248_0748 [Schleiferilactobacillus shenzhenensis LY-73]
MSEVLNHKVNFSVIVGVRNANPNGDPNDEGRPRVNGEGYGEISDVSVKRKIRNRWQDTGKPILVKAVDRSDDEYLSIRDRFLSNDNVAELLTDIRNSGKKSSDKVLHTDAQKRELRAIACANWLDVRAFGALLPFKESVKDGLESASTGIRGPVSINIGETIQPVEMKDMAITKSTNFESEEKKGSDTMGNKSMIGFAVYRIDGAISPQQAEQTGFTDEDAESLKMALKTLFVDDASASRPDGSMEVLALIWAESKGKISAIPAYQINDLIHVNQPESARQFRDITIEVEPSPTPELIITKYEGQ